VLVNPEVGFVTGATGDALEPKSAVAGGTGDALEPDSVAGAEGLALEPKSAVSGAMAFGCSCAVSTATSTIFAGFCFAFANDGITKGKARMATDNDILLIDFIFYYF